LSGSSPQLRSVLICIEIIAVAVLASYANAVVYDCHCVGARG
jgi:hypothetical protein